MLADIKEKRYWPMSTMTDVNDSRCEREPVLRIGDIKDSTDGNVKESIDAC